MDSPAASPKSRSRSCRAPGHESVASTPATAGASPTTPSESRECTAAPAPARPRGRRSNGRCSRTFSPPLANHRDTSRTSPIHHFAVAHDKLALAHLSLRLTRQAFDELDPAGTLVVRQIAAREGDDLLGADSLTGSQLDNCQHQLAHIRVRNADDGDVGDLR